MAELAGWIKDAKERGLDLLLGDNEDCVTQGYLLWCEHGLDLICKIELQDREIKRLRGEIADAHSAQDTQIGLLREEIERLRNERKAYRQVAFGYASDYTRATCQRPPAELLETIDREAAEAAGGEG